MKTLIHKILYKTLPLQGYLRAVSRLFFLWQRLGIGRHAAATEYVYHLPELVGKGDTAIDIGANLGYYARTISRLAGPAGKVYAVEPVPPVLAVLHRNLRGCTNVEILPYALGTQDKEIKMANDSAHTTGYLGTGQNFVGESPAAGAVEFTARMRRGSELFAYLERLDFVKCDIEGYEVVVMNEMRALLERFHPTVLIETGGANRPLIVELFTELGYAGFTLEKGREIPLSESSTKDIIFRGPCDIRVIHKYSMHNRKSLEADNLCGCFYCRKIFNASEISDWVEDTGGDTGLCPYCGIDSVLGESSGAPMTKEFMEKMNKYWF